MPNDYSKTVNLPRTRFPMKADLPKREPSLLEFWEKRGIYRKMMEGAAQRKAKPYVLHDGPPYANGHIHIGHALNKILKDIVVKSQALMGRQAPYVPGWDCHGLPIEHSLLKDLKMSKRDVKDIPAFRDKAKEFAKKFIAVQRDEFRRLGGLGDWDKPYVTMSKEYESRVLRAFRLLFGKGYIYRGLKPVYWCVYCETALAEAEIEYKDKTSPSVYVAFPILNAAAPNFPDSAEVLIWTTTPWTLPANMAVAFHPDLEYALIEVGHPGWGKPRKLLLAKARLEAVLAALGGDKGHKILGAWKGKDIVPGGPDDAGKRKFAYQRPFGGQEGIGVLADYVTAEDGTGVVHTAPGHGADDFYTGQKWFKQIVCPVDGSGRFTQETGELAGKQVFKEGNPAVCEALRVSGRLLAQGEITHSYPHCWRCKNPIIFRATEQWFLNVSHEGLRQRLLKAVQEVQWIPPEGQARIASMVEGRPDWCLSRQRVWGTPITILYCAKCRTPLTDSVVLEAIEKRVASEGSNFWFADWGKEVRLGPPDGGPSSPSREEASKSAGGESSKDMAGKSQGVVVWDFFPREIRCPGAACKGETFHRETDILDVWMDSGASWLAVLDPAQVPCDLYLEGSDQHRGWFQSSLVLSVAINGRAPYKKVLTHGFVLDEQGRAMHKSLGNVVSPQEVVGKVGADVLREWAALSDYSDDVRLSAKLLDGPTEAYRKVRNTLRYLLGNTFDFDPAKHAVPFERMQDADRYVLHLLGELVRGVRSAYEEFRFRAAARELSDFCNLTLSAFYLDAAKDRLYTLAPDAPARRSAQTALFECLRCLATLSAPILSFTAEETWQEARRTLAELRGEKPEEMAEDGPEGMPESVFLAQIPEAPWSEPALAERWKTVLAVRARVNKAIEEARAAGKVGGSLEAKVRLKGGANGDRSVLEAYKDQWPEILIVSQAEVQSGAGELTVEVVKADGRKCVRCWRWQVDVGNDAVHPELCSRCVRQLNG